jgi:DHA2 family multidrug resistance protein-like MFS transporter
MGALLTIRYTNYFTRAFASLSVEQAQNLSQQVATTMSKSFAGAVQVAQQYSAYSAQTLNAAKTAFLQGQDAAYIIGIIAVIVAVLFVLFVYPNKTGEDATFAELAR